MPLDYTKLNKKLKLAYIPAITAHLADNSKVRLLQGEKTEFHIMDSEGNIIVKGVDSETNNRE